MHRTYRLEYDQATPALSTLDESKFLMKEYALVLFFKYIQLSLSPSATDNNVVFYSYRQMEYLSRADIEALETTLRGTPYSVRQLVYFLIDADPSKGPNMGWIAQRYAKGDFNLRQLDVVNNDVGRFLRVRDILPLSERELYGYTYNSLVEKINSIQTYYIVYRILEIRDEPIRVNDLIGKVGITGNVDQRLNAYRTAFGTQDLGIYEFAFPDRSSVEAFEKVMKHIFSTMGWLRVHCDQVNCSRDVSETLNFPIEGNSARELRANYTYIMQAIADLTSRNYNHWKNGNLPKLTRVFNYLCQYGRQCNVRRDDLVQVNKIIRSMNMAQYPNEDAMIINLYPAFYYEWESPASNAKAIFRGRAPSSSFMTDT